MKVCTLSVTVTYDETLTTEDDLVDGLNTVMENAMSTEGLLDGLGEPYVGGFEVLIGADVV